jgi:hypothetical protein
MGCVTRYSCIESIHANPNIEVMKFNKLSLSNSFPRSNAPYTNAKRHLAFPYSRSRGLVCVWSLSDLVQIDQNTWVRALVGSREGCKGSRRTTSSTADLDLRAGKIELSLVGLRSHVQRNMFDTKKVITIGSRLGNGSVGSDIFIYAAR